MLNNIMLVGRISTTHLNENIIELSVNRSYKNEEGIYESDIIPINLSSQLLKNARDYLSNGDLIGVKGRIENHNTRLIVIADKLTFLSSHTPQQPTQENTQHSLTEGEI